MSDETRDTRDGVGTAEEEADASAERTDSAGADESTDSASADESTDSASTDESKQAGRSQGRRVSVSLRTLGVSALIAALVAGLGVVVWLYIGAKGELDDQARQEADTRHVEKIALDYAVNAAMINFKDLGPWKQNLGKGTSPELAKKLTDAGTAMEQILLPLQWSSTAKPLAAKVRSNDNGLYVVDAFVSVETKTVQAAEDLQSTATYSITINSSDNWVITDVGGIAAVVGEK